MTDSTSTPNSDQAHRLPFTGSHRRELEVAIEAAVTAGLEILGTYLEAAFSKYTKNDGSPVTDADLAADRIIRSVIQREFPADSLLTEEGQDDRDRLQASRCWIADPIDGTEQFIRRTGEFDVLVAFVIDGRPAAVVGYQPTTATLVIAEKDRGAWVSVGGREFFRIVFGNVHQPLRIASSKWFGAPRNSSLIERIAHEVGAAKVLKSSELGFSPRMFLAPRSIDAMIGIRVDGNQDMASEWDFAVTDLVISEAGGAVTDLTGMPFQYNKPIPVNSGGLVASVSPEVQAEVLAAIKSVGSGS